MDKKLIGFWVDAELHDYVKALCAKNGTKIKDFMVKAMKDAIKKYKNK